MYKNIMSDFQTYLVESGLKDVTIKNHISNFDKLINIFGDDLYTNSDEDLSNTIRKMDITLSQKLTISATLSKFLQFRELPNDYVVELIFEINKSLKDGYLKRNKNTKFQYTKKQIIDEMMTFYEKNKLKKFITSYLIIKYNVRNKDVRVVIVKHNKYTNKEENFLVIRKNSILYIRNDYKTKNKYGTIKVEIKNVKFVDSVKRYYDENIDESILLNGVELFKGFANSTKLIKQQLPYGLTQAMVMKIILNEKNTLSNAYNISKSRGTSMEVLQENYNIRK